MPLVIPTAATTYADSTNTGGEGLLRKYVLAQYRSDANHEWVRELRRLLVKDELKYEHFRGARPKLMHDRSLWGRIEAGVAQATVIIIDPEGVMEVLRAHYLGQDAEPGIDFTDDDLHEKCATALIAGTPIAYLPYELVRVTPWSMFLPIGNLHSFAPSEIQKEIGPGLRDAKVFAARAHAMFDVVQNDRTVATTRDVIRSPLARVLLYEVIATQRMFDKEHPRSADLLDHAVQQIAETMLDDLPVWENGGEERRIQEVDSRAIDEIQAADITAGWARELLELGNLRGLADRFGRVYVNGKIIDRIIG
jgi:hypothetical protein